MLDHEGKHHPYLDESERDIGVQLTAPPLHIAGPVHLNLSGWAEQIIHDGPKQYYNGGTWREAEAQRFTYKPSLSLTQWFGGYGFDWEAGIQAAHERNGSRINYRNNSGFSEVTSRVEVKQQSRYQSFASAGLRLRLEREWGAEEVRYKHIFTRLGFDFTREDKVTLGKSGSTSALRTNAPL